jgi:hypothetical protein
MDIGSFPQVTRLIFDTGQPHEEFRARHEAAGSRRSTRSAWRNASRPWDMVGVVHPGCSAPRCKHASLPSVDNG